MDTFDYTAGVETTDTFEIWRRKTNGVITKISSGSSGANPDVGYPTWITTGDFTISGTGTLNAKDIYCRNIYSGSGTSTGDSVIELGDLRTDIGNAILDLHSSTQPDYDARIHKESGRDGNFNIANKGSGIIKFTQETGTGNFTFNHTGNDRLIIGNAGITVGTAGLNIPLTVNGDIIAQGTTAKIQNTKTRIDSSDIYEYATNADTALNINRVGYLGGTTRFRNTIIYDGKGVELVSFNGNAKTVTIGNDTVTCSLTTKGSITGSSLSAGSSGTIGGGAVTCTSLNTQTGNISCGNINTSGIYTQTGKTKPIDWGGGVTTFDVYSDGGTIGIGVSGTIMAAMDKFGAISGTSVTSGGQIYGSTLKTDSTLTFTAGTGNGSTDTVTIERVNPLNDVSELRITIGDNVDGVSGDALIIGTVPLGVWTEKLKVTSNGNVNAAGSVTAGTTVTAGTAVTAGTTVTAGTSISAGTSITAGTTVTAGGDVIAYSTSDRKYKNNIKNITDPLGKVSQINGVSFDWNDKQTIFSGHDIGVIAQDVEAVLPEIVTTRQDGSKAVKYDKMVALLIECVKELKSEIEELKLSIK